MAFDVEVAGTCCKRAEVHPLGALATSTCGEESIATDRSTHRMTEATLSQDRGDKNAEQSLTSVMCGGGGGGGGGGVNSNIYCFVKDSTRRDRWLAVFGKHGLVVEKEE